MIVAGVMSGTSADGINIALVRFADSNQRARKRQPHPASPFQVIGHAEYPYPETVRAAILAAMNAHHASVPDLARLNFLLGDLYADSVLAAQRRFRTPADLVGCHGQTLYHQGDAAPYLGRKIAATWECP
jgi:anhydro-N-acetylmuramic acid kinase